MITQSQLIERLLYNPETGVFVWRISPHHNSPAGSIAGTVCSSGHIQIKLFSRAYMAHRLAWLYMTGQNPVGVVDHINRTPGDNRWPNLRCASLEQNARNRVGTAAKSGHRGVYWNGNNRKWQASIRVGGQNKSLGYYDSVAEAASARVRAERELWGDFAPSAQGSPNSASILPQPS